MSDLYVIINFILLLFSAGLIAKRIQDGIDGYPFVIGLQTVLKQFHPDCVEQFLKYLSQYTMSHIENTTR